MKSSPMKGRRVLSTETLLEPALSLSITMTGVGKQNFNHAGALIPLSQMAMYSGIPELLIIIAWTYKSKKSL